MTRDEAEAALRRAVAHREGAEDYETAVTTEARDGLWRARVVGTEGQAQGVGSTEERAIVDLVRGLMRAEMREAAAHRGRAERLRAEADELDRRAAEATETARVLREALR